MLKLLERNIASIEDRLVLLAPPRASTHRFFRNVEIDPGLHDGLVGEMQSLRGSMYLDDGAIGREELSSAGRHQTPEERRAGTC